MPQGVAETYRGDRLIIRVLRGRVDADRVDYLHDRVRRALADACPDHGCTWAHMGRQVHGDRSEEIVMVTVWSSMDALYSWVGGVDLLGTPIQGGDVEVFDYYDVQHYETLEPIGEADLEPAPESLLRLGV